jgi:hypothetical protein
MIILAFISTLVAIITLIFQIHYVIKQLKLQNFTEYTGRYHKILLNLPENINSDGFSFEKMKKYKKEKTLRYIRAYYDLCSEEFYLKMNRYLSKEVWKLWEAGMESAFKKKAFKEAWNIIQKDTYYSKEFENFVLDKR